VSGQAGVGSFALRIQPFCNDILYPTLNGGKVNKSFFLPVIFMAFASNQLSHPGKKIEPVSGISYDISGY
jgi:hypothetical protein